MSNINTQPPPTVTQAFSEFKENHKHIIGLLGVSAQVQMINNNGKSVNLRNCEINFIKEINLIFKKEILSVDDFANLKILITTPKKNLLKKSYLRTVKSEAFFKELKEFINIFGLIKLI